MGISSFAFRRGKKSNRNFKMAHEFSEEQVEEFKDAFELFDRTGEGVIAWSECSSLARCFGFNPTDSKVKILLVGSEEEEDLPSAADMAGKSISFDDFLPILWGNATISSAELRHVMMNLGEKLTNDEVSQLLEGMEDLNGLVNYDNFIKKVMSDSDAPQED